MPHVFPTPVPPFARRPSSRDVRWLRLLGAAVTLVVLLVASVSVLPFAGLLMFVAALALLFVLPFVVVTGVVDSLAPVQ